MQTVSDPDKLFQIAQKKFEKLSLKCNIANKTKHVPVLAPQMRQIAILKRELNENQLKLKVAKNGRYVIQSNCLKNDIKQSIANYENLTELLENEMSQEEELDTMNRLVEKQILELSKAVPTEHNEREIMKEAESRLRRLEKKLQMVTERFCTINTDNKRIREEINTLLVERANFNIQWNRTIESLIKGKEYLMDIMEVATNVCEVREKICKRLTSLTYKGVYLLNKDILEMQNYDNELNRLAKEEEFLRIKGSYRHCQADEIAKARSEKRLTLLKEKIVAYDELLTNIFDFAGTTQVSKIIRKFNRTEEENETRFRYLCDLVQHYIDLNSEQEALHQSILDQQDMNQARQDNQERRIAQLTEQLETQSKRNEQKRLLSNAAEEQFFKVLAGIRDLIDIGNCDLTPLLKLLGKNTEITRWNVSNCLKILECEIKNLIQVAYASVKTPAQTPSKKNDFNKVKIVADPHLPTLRPNRINILVPFTPCPYCVEDYILNIASEKPVAPADKAYVESIFHLEPANTKYGIYTLTEPSKRHPARRR